MLIDIAIPVPLHHPFTYAVPEALMGRIEPGMRVLVPFHRRKVIGIALGPPASSLTFPTPPKPILDCLDDRPAIAPPLLTLAHWISRYYAAPIGEVCRAALPRALFRTRTRPATSRLPPAHLGDGVFHRGGAVALTDAQTAAAAAITHAVQRAAYACFLLHGVTGSGKTEVYLHVIAETLAAGRAAILLVPEIGLTPQLLSRVTGRFGEQVAIYHSGLTEAQRALQWRRMQHGEARVCVGTRSALFAPFDTVGCLIVDEEHDASYKQEESPRYHARDTAVMRGLGQHAVVVLGSATPSLETFRNAEEKRYRYLALPTRATGVAMPAVELIDLRSPTTGAKTATVFSEPLFAAIDATLQARAQVLLFFNRRGFAPTLLCRGCGYVFRCPNCDIGLVVHRHAHELRCHYCEYAAPAPAACPTCRTERLLPLGVGTERIEQMLRARFPTARIARFDRDTGSARQARESLLQRMHRHEIDILIGTQMIAKGHDFPNVGLVGVLSADQALYIPDFRAGERTFQLLTQVAGRTGRRETQGRVMIQTFTPDHYSLAHARTGDYRAFAAEETRHRQALDYPPFGRLVNIRISGNKEESVETYAQALAVNLRTYAPTHSRTAVLGPAPAPLKKLAGKYRWQLLVKAGSARALAPIAQAAITHAADHAPRGIHVACDVDPVSLL
ncbi:MAG: primosomal protein N' [Deltaproteobacteria bacterium]|nr:primosomal protein N' [Deltaproteobacteria bacterium]